MRFSAISAACWRFAPDRKASELPSRVNSVSLLANKWVLYHKNGLKSSEIVKNLQDSAPATRDKRLQTQDLRLKTQDSRLKTQDLRHPEGYHVIASGVKLEEERLRISLAGCAAKYRLR